ncbi:hypothetical protein OEZ85_010365 [Tetradesmus obliquus]|uniref:MYND-type domain-containing protein n=1 Tax=Tetradesmus obliquus TaxID=3088 RepID=A0ABY8TPE0_TETOB|nr:hypothetical protein OEZ85_010365 [Tetradesmus obliquus]
MCAGCGCRSFFNADGAQLQPCPGCGQAFYCSDACREFDYPSHKAECRFRSTGRWHAAGIRPSWAPFNRFQNLGHLSQAYVAAYAA